MVQIASILEKVFLHRDKPPLLRGLLYAAYVIPPVAIALLTWHEMTNTEMVWPSTEITRPHDAYRSERKTSAAAGIARSATIPSDEYRTHWRPTDAHRSAFLSEFSKAYFSRPSRFNVFLPDMERASLTVILKNDASSRSILVNSISVVAMLEHDRPFDWRSLDVSADLTVRPGEWNGALAFVNTGIGPILRLAATLTSDSGWRFEPFQPDGGLAHDWPMSLTPEDDAYVGPFTDIENTLAETLYRVIDDDDSPISDGVMVDCRPPEPIDDRCIGVVRDLYEEVTSVARLAELTDLQRVSAIDIDYRFEDLKGNPKSGQESVTLPEQLYWYRGNDQLLDTLPPIDDLSTSLAYDEAVGADWPSEGAGDGFGSVDFVGLAKQLFGVAVEGPKGVGLITTELDIDLEDMPECGFAKAIAEPRTLLQGSGFVSISVNLNRPRNGQYLLRFLINGDDRHALSVDFLVPDQLRFDSDVQTTQFIDYNAGPPTACGAAGHP